MSLDCFNNLFSLSLPTICYNSESMTIKYRMRTHQQVTGFSKLAKPPSKIQPQISSFFRASLNLEHLQMINYPHNHFKPGGFSLCCLTLTQRFQLTLFSFINQISRVRTNRQRFSVAFSQLLICLPGFYLCCQHLYC